MIASALLEVLAIARTARARARLVAGGMLFLAASAAHGTQFYHPAELDTRGQGATAWSRIGPGEIVSAAAAGQSDALLAPVCGNGLVEPGEQCDNGAMNGTLGNCCTATCEAAVSGTACPGGTCDGMGTCSCGNGVIEPGEPCDDGAANGTGDTCCAVDCQVQPSGTPCADDGDLCTSEGCVGFIDICAHWVAPSGGCATPTVAGGASIRLRTRRGRNRAQFKWGKGPTVQLADFGDPGSELTRLCIYRQPGHQYFLIAGASPSGPPGEVWTQTSTGWKFKSRTGAPDGVTGVRLEAGMPLKAKVKVSAQGNPAFSLPLPQEPAMVVQFKTSLGTCWEATFLTAVKSTASEFKAKSDGP